MTTSSQLIDNRYQIVQAIGKGGFGTVYEAVDTRLNKTVALKKLILTGAAADQSFAREAKMLNGLSHPVLPSITDTFMEAGDAYIVMEFVPGVTITCGSYMGDWESGGVEYQGGFGDNWRCYPTSYDQEDCDGTQHRGNCTPAAPRL